MSKENDTVEEAIAKTFEDHSDIFPEDIDLQDCRIEAMQRFIGNMEGKFVLDVGCAKGRITKILAAQGAIATGIDPSKRLLALAREQVQNANFVAGSVANLPFPDNTFDTVICIETLEHIPDTKKAIAEMVRVAKPHAQILIVDKNIFSLHEKLFIPSVAIKWWAELNGKWFYPRSFPFREKWFTSIAVRHLLLEHVSSVDSEYLRAKHNVILKFLPFFNLFIAWKAIK
ncbi:MAG: class I SAM-dependent methyltransferase [Candidatus Wildermuthbacteria bacterium]|nr:class I SAM-dependent methyltransferase [Candidatus Wildermuthbacteria bacterium]